MARSLRAGAMVGAEREGNGSAGGMSLRSFTRQDLRVVGGGGDGAGAASSAGAGAPVRGSSGAFWAATRCAAGPSNSGSGHDAYLATGKEVYAVSGLHGEADLSGGSGRKQGYVLGKEGVTLPLESPRAAALVPLPAFAHRHEVQSIALWDEAEAEAEAATARRQFLASVDSTGSLCVCEFQGREGRGVELAPQRSYQGLPASCAAMEAGWAGVALGLRQPTKAVVARHFSKDLNIFDGDLRARTIRTVQNPTAIRTFGEETYLVAETNKLAL